ncbi:MAG TPA: hypothetical protein VFU81_10020, partial [Thermomicrobiales bacterium]|nr:hypothetical protein [Thermomicrobiales bacterium]
ASGVICVSECCSAKTDVCNPQTGECCAPKTCRDYPPGMCGSQDNGCGGTVDCGCCPGTPCACPPGRTLCDGFRGPVVYCPGTNCLCVGRADGQGSVCYRGGTCYNDDAICQTDADCAAAGAPGFNCVKAGDCALGCDRTACVAPCAGNASGPRRPRISVRPSPERQRPADAVGAPNVGFA